MIFMKNEFLKVEISSFKVSAIQAGIRQLLKQIDAKLWFCNIILHRPVAQEDRPYIEAEYYSLNEEEIKNREDYLKAADLIISKKNVPISIIEGPITMIRIQNPLKPAELQDDVIRLLDTVINTLDKYKDDEVIDLIYHDFINDDALHQPYIHIYLAAEQE